MSPFVAYSGDAAAATVNALPAERTRRARRTRVILAGFLGLALPGLLPATASLARQAAASAGRPDATPVGMTIDRNVPVPMQDGVTLRANVFRPIAPGAYPVILAMSAYGKDVHPRDFLPSNWTELERHACGAGTSCRHLRYEVSDPERWVPHGYIVINIDVRGSGRSPGYLDPRSPQETRDLYDAIEWAGTQPWSNGRVGLLGISYYAVNQWQVAALRPPHLAAIIPWEGYTDYYRDTTHHGGIPSNNFLPNVWWPIVAKNQHGNPDGFPDAEDGRPITGAAIDETMLAGSRIDLPGQVRARPLDDEWYRARTPRLERIAIPLLSAANWGGLGNHLRGNIEGFDRAGSKDKWLTVHTGTHFSTFYQPVWLAVQRRFFDRYLKGLRNGWEDRPRVELTIRGPDGETLRNEDEWPLARTRWTRFYLDGSGPGLVSAPPRKAEKLSYQALGEGVSFVTAPFARDTEITGPVAARLWVESSTTDLDLFVTLQALRADGSEITFQGANDPAAPLTQGWLRASHRKTDPAKSRPWRPWLTHDELQPLVPDQPYAVDVEIWPTSFAFPAGSRLKVTIQGQDFARAPSAAGAKPPSRNRGSGPFLHLDREPGIYGGVNRIYTGGARSSYLLLPVIPPR